MHWWLGKPIDLEAKSRLYRRRRFGLVLKLVDRILLTKKCCRILDIGGVPQYWENVRDLIGQRNCHVTLLNLTSHSVDQTSFTSIVGDARDLSWLTDKSFDLVHSNSVIEHVGRWQDMKAMSSEIRRLASSYLVQTPYFWFPIDPHWATAFFHWLPRSIRVSMLMRRSHWHIEKSPDVDTAMELIESTVLLDYKMLVALFPDAVIHRERFCGLTKSLIAVRDGV